MTSIQSQLTRRLVAAMIAFSVLSGGALFLVLRHTLWREFDRSLAVRTHALQSLITRNSGGELDIDVFLQSLPEFTKASPPEYFEIIDANGARVLASSDRPLIPSASNGNEHWDAALPGGVPARAMRVAFTPSLDDDEADESKSAARTEPSKKYRLPLTLTVARDSRPMTTLQLRIAGSIGAATLLLSAFTVIASVWIVRRGLRSLRAVASDAASIDFRNPAAHFETSAIPAEIMPLVQKLNDLLHRVSEAFARERQFTAAVSHELRTPIAELRSAAEVALREPANERLSQRAITQSREIALQMQAIVSTLLSIVSTERAAETVRLTPTNLIAAAEHATSLHAERLRARRIQLTSDIEPTFDVLADPGLLNAVLDNLLGNAAQYAAEGSTLSLHATGGEDTVRLLVDNDVLRLTPADVKRMFDPFWRKESSRSTNEHVGLGLTLTQTYCLAMHATIEAAMLNEKRLQIAITFQRPRRSQANSHRDVLTPSTIGGPV